MTADYMLEVFFNEQTNITDWQKNAIRSSGTYYDKNIKTFQ